MLWRTSSHTPCARYAIRHAVGKQQSYSMYSLRYMACCGHAETTLHVLATLYGMLWACGNYTPCTSYAIWHAVGMRKLHSMYSLRYMACCGHAETTLHVLVTLYGILWACGSYTLHVLVTLYDILWACGNYTPCTSYAIWHSVGMRKLHPMYSLRYMAFCGHAVAIHSMY